MAYLWMTQSCWGGSSSIFQWPFSFLFNWNLLGWDWFATPYCFEVHNSIKRNLHTALPQDKPLSMPVYPLFAHFFWFLVSESAVSFKVSTSRPSATIRRTYWVLHLCSVWVQEVSGKEETHRVQWLGEMPGWRVLIITFTEKVHGSTWRARSLTFFFNHSYTLWGEYCSLHCMHEKTEAQRGYLTWTRSHSSQVKKLRFSFRSGTCLPIRCQSKAPRDWVLARYLGTGFQCWEAHPKETGVASSTSSHCF